MEKNVKLIHQELKQADKVLSKVGGDSSDVGGCSSNLGQKKSSVRQTRDFIFGKYDIRLNSISNVYEIKLKDQSDYVELNEAELLFDVKDNGYAISSQTLGMFLNLDCVEKYNPFKEYFEMLPKWDNATDYIGRLFDYLHLDQTDTFIPIEHIRKWFVRVVRCALEDSYFNKQMLVLVQAKQSGGKSSFCRFLCPKSLEQYSTETIATGKDEEIQLTTKFLIMYDELAKMSKDDIQHIKSVVSRDKVNVRLPYAPRDTMRYRRCSFIGNTNDDEFLTDPTGSVRFLCIRLTSDIDFAYSKDISIDDCWSQAYAMYLKDKNCGEVTKEDQRIIEDYNRDFQRLDEAHEFVNKYFVPQYESSEDFRYATASDVMTFINTVESTARFTKNVQFGRALKFFNFEQVSVRRGIVVKKFYKVCLRSRWKEQFGGFVLKTFEDNTQNSQE